jgi:hypothetical protein
MWRSGGGETGEAAEGKSGVTLLRDLKFEISDLIGERRRKGGGAARFFTALRGTSGRADRYVQNDNGGEGRRIHA